MKITAFTPPAGNLGQALELNTATGELKQLYWLQSISRPPTAVQSLRDGRVTGITGYDDEVSGYRFDIVRAMEGEASGEPTTPLLIHTFTRSVLLEGGMVMSPDNKYAVGCGSFSPKCVVVDMSPSSNYQPLRQEVGSFTAFDSYPMLMSFEDGNTRVVSVDSDGFMHLSTVLGNGQPLDYALSAPVPADIPVADSESSRYAIGAIVLGKLALAAQNAGLGTASFYDAWKISGPAPSLSADYGTGLGAVITPGAEQQVGFLQSNASPGGPIVVGPATGDQTVIELKARPDYTYEALSTSILPLPSSWFGVSQYQFQLFPVRVKPPFWTGFVRAFAEEPS